MARSIQQAEQRQMMGGRQQMGLMGSMQQHHHPFGGATTAGALRARIGAMLIMMPADDVHRPTVERLHEQLSRMPPDALLQSVDRDVAGIFGGGGGGGQQPPPDRGASPSDIDALPTRIYRAPINATGEAAKTAEVDRVTCMVRTLDR